MELKLELDFLKNCLSIYTPRQIRQATDSLEGKKITRRCLHKIKEIDRQFNICKDVNVFLDLCGGPGEFARYVFLQNFDCRGFGVTLKHQNDYNFTHTNFKKIYGSFDTGNIFDANVYFEIMFHCRDKCDLVLADGAIDVSGNENNQEPLMMPLIQKECDIILQTLRIGGNCVLKIFDTFFSTTISLLQDFVGHFEKYKVFKPRSSRPSNSEKYLVCINRLKTPSPKSFNDCSKFTKNQIQALKEVLTILGLQHGTSSFKK
jgi:23S rRNA U2552 (ribose-2'-O)-methylase RlmE/FtsJ